MTHRTVLAAFVGLIASCLPGGARTRPTDPPPLDRLDTIARATVGDVRVTALRTGWVRVKRPHQEYAGMEALRFPSIVLANRSGALVLPAHDATVFDRLSAVVER